MGQLYRGFDGCKFKFITIHLLLFLMLSIVIVIVVQVFQDEEYLRVVVPDEESFLKRTDAKMMVGHDEEKKLVEGKVITS